MQARVVLRDSVRATDRIYDYIVPSQLQGTLCEGHLVEVPFGGANRPTPALVTEITEDRDTGFTLKEITKLLDPLPVLQKDQLAILSFIHDRYTCTYGDAVRLMVPSQVVSRNEKSVHTAKLTDKELAVCLLEEDEIDSLPQIRVLEYLIEYGETPLQELMSALSVSRSPVDTLRKKGLLAIGRAPSHKAMPTECESDSAAPTKPHPASPAQQNAIDTILTHEGKKEYLLFGVTGSGKTEVYLQCASEILNRGGSVLFLVPEISLTPQMICWIQSRFPAMTAVLHSRLTPKERYEQWNLIRKGKARIVVGARSAVFAPMQNLQLILIDEEQDTSYKSETHPRYHARDIARKRSSVTGAALVLGSATPSVESFYAARSGYAVLLPLPDRIAGRHLPSTRIIDMRKELTAKNRSILSRELRTAMNEALRKGEQVILFLNKRGFASLQLCRACGEAVMCPHCSVAMTVHTPARSKKPCLICHYCGRVQKIPEECPSCGSRVSGKFGLGTEQLEQLIRRDFPDQAVLRMDQDTTAGRDAHARILKDFREKKASILVGTQMIAKGHDFPAVTVVGIIAADLLLRSSDFRATERSFQLITQAAGRAGRGEAAGRVYIQTYQPDDDTIRFAARQDYEGFFENEILYRRRLGYPPFLAVGSILVSHQEERTADASAEKLKEDIREILRTNTRLSSVMVFGPSPAQLYKVKDRFRFLINLKASCKSDLSFLFDRIADLPAAKDVRIGMDIDPIW